MKWNKVFRTFIFLFLLSCNYQLRAFEGEHNSITIAAPLSAPFVFKDEQGNNQGLLVELFALVEQQTGFKANIIIMPWARGMHEVKINKIDALMPAVYTDERAELFVFPKYPLVESRTVFLKRVQDDIVVDDIKQLGKKKIIVKVRAMTMGKAFDDAEKTGLIKVIEVNDYEQAIQMLVTERVDLFASVNYTSHYLLKKLNLQDKIDVLSFSSVDVPAYLVFSQQYAEKNDVNKLMLLIHNIKETKDYQLLVDKFLK